MLRKTFNYLNSALQHQSLNRGIWNRLEAFERDLANFYTVEVRVDVIFDENSQRLATGAVVPSFFKKTMKWDDKTAEFLFPNIDTSGTDWIDYLQK
jgi:DNA/RNA endonuclease G (NUC1)